MPDNSRIDLSSCILTPAQQQSLVVSLLKCRAFQEPQGRDNIVRQLPFANAVARNPAADLDVAGLVETALRYNGGLTALIEAAGRFDAGSIPFEEVSAMIAGFADAPHTIMSHER